MWDDLRLRLRALLKRETVERELDDELRFHLDQQVAQYIQAGYDRNEAVRRARLAFGTLGQIKEEHRDARGIRVVEEFTRDVRYAVRQLGRSPGFAAAAIACLALGIGGTTAIYSVVNTVLLQPLPFPDSDRLVQIVERLPPSGPGRPVRRAGVPYQDVIGWSARASTLSDSIAVTGSGQRTVRTSQGATGLWGAATSANAFAVLGVRPALGRVFNVDDGNSPDVVLLTFDTWKRHFGADPKVVGTTVELSAATLQAPIPPRVLTIVGILPPDFQFPTFPADFYTPLRNSRAPLRTTMIGRLAAGVSIEAATDELNAISAATRPPWPAGVSIPGGSRVDVRRLKDVTTGDLKGALGLFLGSVAVVLLIVCVNVANLLLARGTARRQEMAVRLAIGASRGRIVRQILTECLVLAATGGAFGAMVGAAGVEMVRRLALVEAPGIFALTLGSSILPRANEIHVDVSVLAIAFGLAGVTSVVFGLLPAVLLSHRRHLKAIGPGARKAGPSVARTRAVLVVGQIAMATILLVGAGLLIHSFLKLTGSDKGYDPANVIALQVLIPQQYSVARKAQTIDALLTRLRQLPAVKAAGFARHGVLIGEALVLGTFVPPGGNFADMDSRRPKAQVRSVSDGFLTAMGVPLVDGREFDAADVPSAPPVVVLNRSAARELFGSHRAVGQVVDWYLGDDPVQMTVAGVVEDLRQESLDQDTFPEIYVHYRQLMAIMERVPDLHTRQDEWAIGFVSFAIRTNDAPTSVIQVVRRLVGSVDSTLGIDALLPMTRLVASSVARQRFLAVILGAFAIVAVALAGIGIYGVLAYLVVQRTPEIGVRMALGAEPTQVLALVLREGLVLTIVGITLGLVAAAAASQVLQGMLFGITPLDWVTFLAVAIMFGLVTTLASYLPARRASHVDPNVALRAD